MAKAARSTTIRDRHRGIIRQGEPACGICGNPIDYALPYLDPWSYVVDHIIPLKAWPEGDVLGNKQSAHRHCNRYKSDRMPGVPGTRPAPVVQHYSNPRTWTV